MRKKENGWENAKSCKVLVINFIFFIFALLFCEQKYAVSDDFVMETILSGAYATELNPHMLFVNTLYGYLLMPLYSLFPGVSWYLISLLVVGFFAFVGITYFIFEKTDDEMAVLLTILLLTFFSNDIYVLVQFTKVAALCVFSGALLVIDALFYTDKRSMLLVGAFLCLTGSLIRFQTIFIVAPFVLIILVYSCVDYYKTNLEKADFIKTFIQKFGTGIFIIILVLTCQLYNWYSYQTDDAYQFYYDYTQTRAAIVDSRDLGFSAYEPELTELGISENDYIMLRHWNFSDPEYFTLEKLNDINEVLQDKNAEYRCGLHSLFEQIQARKYSAYPVVMACAILFLLCLIFNTKEWFGYLVTTVLGFGMILLFFLRGRVVYRVEYGIFVGVFLTVLYIFCHKTDKEGTGFINRIALLILIGGCLLRQAPTYIPDSAYKDIQVGQKKSYVDNTFYNSWDYDGRKYRKQVNKTDLSGGLIEEMQANSDYFYLLEFETTIQSLYFDWDAYQSLGTDYYHNFAYLSGVTTNFPDINKLFEENELENPYKALVNEDVYLVDNSMREHILQYLREHYYPEARVEWIKNVEGYDIWKFYEE